MLLFFHLFILSPGIHIWFQFVRKLSMCVLMYLSSQILRISVRKKRALVSMDPRFPACPTSRLSHGNYMDDKSITAELFSDLIESCTAFREYYIVSISIHHCYINIYKHILSLPFHFIFFNSLHFKTREYL